MTGNSRQSAIKRQLATGALLVSFAAFGAAPVELPYQAQFLVEVSAGVGDADARIRITQPDARLRSLRLRMPEERFSLIKGSGRIQRTGEFLTWSIPPTGGDLSYRVTVTHERNSKGKDAYIGPQWALFRGEDVFPSADAVLRRGARGESELLLKLPPGWTSQTPYLRDAAGRVRIDARGRSFARPVGWMIAGKIGSRMDVIGPTTVRIAAPIDRPAPRVPMLALIRWTLPVLQSEVQIDPGYLLIVLAGQPMWRGGLSGPNSLYSHVDRPLISENGTSTLVHELMHVFAPVPAAPDHDWIDEGIAEYLGLVVMKRSGTISPERFEHALDLFRKRGAEVKNMLTRNAGGVVKARAVVIFGDLDKEIQRRSSGQRDIFDLVRLLMKESTPADLSRLRELARQIAGPEPLSALGSTRVPVAR